MPEKLDPYDYEAFKKSHTKFYVGCKCRDWKSRVSSYYRYEGGDRPDESFRVTASCFKIVKTAGMKLLDGGCTDSIPVKAFAKMGYNKDVVVLTRHKGIQEGKRRDQSDKACIQEISGICKAVYKRPDV